MTVLVSRPFLNYFQGNENDWTDTPLEQLLRHGLFTSFSYLLPYQTLIPSLTSQKSASQKENLKQTENSGSPSSLRRQSLLTRDATSSTSSEEKGPLLDLSTPIGVIEDRNLIKWEKRKCLHPNNCGCGRTSTIIGL